jgi:hypothetical protein
MDQAEVLLIGGRAGVGKTTVGWEVSARLRAATVPHCVIEESRSSSPWEIPQHRVEVRLDRPVHPAGGRLSEPASVDRGNLRHLLWRRCVRYQTAPGRRRRPSAGQSQGAAAHPAPATPPQRRTPPRGLCRSAPPVKPLADQWPFGSLRAARKRAETSQTASSSGRTPALNMAICRAGP